MRSLISQAIGAAHRLGKPIGICGQAPSDYPDFAAWLVEQGITSISLNPDVAISTAVKIASAEAAMPSREGNSTSAAVSAFEDEGAPPLVSQ